MDSATIAEHVRVFMSNHPSGWIREQDVWTFFQEKCSLRDVCTALSQLEDEESLESIVKFLENIAGFTSVADVLTQQENLPFLKAALQSPSDRLRGMVVTTLATVKKPSLPFELDTDIVYMLLTDDDTGISLRACKLITGWVQVTIKDDSEKLAYVSSLVKLYETHPGMNETNEFRFISLFIDISRASSSLFDAVREKRIFEPILSKFLSSTSDLLVKLGSLTLIESLAQFENGQRYLAQVNVLSALERELGGPLADSTTQASLLISIGSIIPFAEQPEQVRAILNQSTSHVPSVLGRFVVSPDNSERMCAMKVFALIARSADTSAPVATFMNASWRALAEMTYALTDVDVEVVNTTIDSIRAIIKHWERNPFMQSTESQSVLVNQILETFKRHPFPECRCLVYSLLSVVVLQEALTDVALSIILTEPSPIRAALLDYQSEANYDARRAKCDFVRVLVKMEEKNVLKKFFKKDQVENFIDFAEKGIEWVPVSKAKDEMETEAL